VVQMAVMEEEAALLLPEEALVVILPVQMEREEEEEVIQPLKTDPHIWFKQQVGVVVVVVKIQLAEPVEPAEEQPELLEEIPEEQVDRAERKEEAVLVDLQEPAVPQMQILVLQTQEELVKIVAEVEVVPGCMVEVEEVETMTELVVEVVAQVSELSKQPAQAQLRGTRPILTAGLPVWEVLPKPMAILDASLLLRDVPVAAAVTQARTLRPPRTRF